MAIHDHLLASGWLATGDHGYDLTSKGVKGLESLGVDLVNPRTLRRRFAYPCLDWSERRPHLGGALGYSLLALFQRKKWVTADLDSRALSVTRDGKRELLEQLDLHG